MTERLPIAVLAKKTADIRRSLMTVFTGERGVRVSLDLMGIEHPQPEHLAYAHMIADVHHTTLADSALFLADHDMVDLLDTAAPTMPDQELRITDLLVPRGFIYFAKPLPDRSGIPPEIPIHGLSWAYLPAESPLLFERNPGESVLITSYVTVEDQLQSRHLLTPDSHIAPGTPKFMPNATVVWTIDTLIGHAFGEVPPPGGYTPGFYQRVLAAFWTLAQQPKMTATSHAAPGKPTDQRRHRRAGVTDPNAPVSVVRLQHRPHARTDAVAADPTGRKVTVRHAVRGHWKNQWMPSLQLHRHIYIQPHLRGPEDAPLVGGERIFLAHGHKPGPAAN